MNRILLTLALLASLLACSPGSEEESEFWGEWVLAQGTGIDLVESHPITITLEAGGQAGGTAACNSYGGEYQLVNGDMAIGQVAATEMACTDPGVMEAEAAYLRALIAVDGADLDASELVLSGPDVELRFAPGP